MTSREKKLLKIVMAPWLKPKSVSFDEWCAAFDELYQFQPKQ